MSGYSYEFLKERMAREAKAERWRLAKRLAIVLIGGVAGLAIAGGLNSKIYADGDVFGIFAAVIGCGFGALVGGYFAAYEI